MKKHTRDGHVEQSVSDTPIPRRSKIAPAVDLEVELARARAYLAANRADFLVRSAKARLALPDCEITVMAGPVPEE
ncbi:hypothetical protein F2P45_10980 [Massilia sp. CCM 8733]|uniref:Uncharacterized protein n=1 Tax=Massilia mucilaginosa TaxID=2609282 RepID=A0ABX0NRY1_9BURK|nr:hypothetical protein [Massilia mucilaginosa]NHZ89534.1 hypothetical protein [Massilia mucilaginosa]